MPGSGCCWILGSKRPLKFLPGWAWQGSLSIQAPSWFLDVKKASLGLLLLCREMSSCLDPVVVGS